MIVNIKTLLAWVALLGMIIIFMWALGIIANLLTNAFIFGWGLI